jgi:hypothetical protein
MRMIDFEQYLEMIFLKQSTGESFGSWFRTLNNEEIFKLANDFAVMSVCDYIDDEVSKIRAEIKKTKEAINGNVREFSIAQ